MPPFFLRLTPEEAAHAGDLARMEALLRREQERWGDTQPLSSPTPKPKEVDLTGRERIPDRWQPDWIRQKYFRGREPSERNQEANQREAAAFGPAHCTRVTLEEEVHVIHVAVATRQIHAGEMAARPHGGQVFSMYAHQLQPELLVLEGELKGPAAQSALYLDMRFDCGLYVGGHDIGDGRIRLFHPIPPRRRTADVESWEGP